MQKDFPNLWKTWKKRVPRTLFLCTGLLKTALTSVPSSSNLDVRIETFFIIYVERSNIEYVSFPVSTAFVGQIQGNKAIFALIHSLAGTRQ